MNLLTISNRDGCLITERMNEFRSWRIFTHKHTVSNEYAIVMVKDDDYNLEQIWHAPKNWDLL